MTAARHAEPGERYIIFGHPHHSLNGQTGRCLHIEHGAVVTRAVDFTLTRPLMAIDPDHQMEGVPRLCGGQPYYVLPRMWLYAIDGGDDEDLEDEDLEDDRQLLEEEKL